MVLLSVRKKKMVCEIHKHLYNCCKEKIKDNSNDSGKADDSQSYIINIEDVDLIFSEPVNEIQANSGKQIICFIIMKLYIISYHLFR